jgi:hypothetical protein
MAGFVYVMSNPAFPHLVKIGKSTKDPTKERVNELNHTGVPAAFKVEYFAFVVDEDGLERKLHAKFSEKRFSANREFFQIGISEAILAVRGTAKELGWLKYEETLYRSPKDIEDLRWKAELAQWNIEFRKKLEAQKELDAKEAEAKALAERKKQEATLQSANRRDHHELEESNSVQRSEASAGDLAWQFLKFFGILILILSVLKGLS